MAKRAKAGGTAAAKPRKKIHERNCSVGRTVAIIGDGWSFMILRECYFGVRRFQDFQSMLGLPRATLITRLRRLTDKGVLRTMQYQDRPPRFEYRLTRMGFELYGVMIAMLAFGDKWLAGGTPAPLVLQHTSCGRRTRPKVVCSHCREEVVAEETTYRPGLGAGTTPVEPGPKSRRTIKPTAQERRRPSSVARTLQVIGDRWSFMVVREAFFGVKRYDDFLELLGIATNILSDRINCFVRVGVFVRSRYQRGPDRYEYRLTEMGKDLFGPFVTMLAWGDRWLSEGAPPLLLTHTKCQHDFTALVTCNHCLDEIVASDMKYEPTYSTSGSPSSVHLLV